MTRFFANAALIFFGLVLALVLGELVMRTYISFVYFNPGERKIYGSFETLPDSQRAYGFRRSNKDLQTNSWGFRGPEFSVERKPDELRIVMLGDSIAAGVRHEWRSTVSESLREILAKTSSETISVYNLAVTGYNTHQQLATLEEVGLRLSPELVILNLCLNDSDPVMPVGQAGLVRKARITRVRDINLRTIIGNSYLLTFIKARFVDLLKRIAPSTLEQLHNPTLLIDSRVSETAWSEMKKAISDIRSISESNHARFFVAIYPYASQVGLPNDALIPQRDLAAFFEKEKIEFVDLIDAYRQSDEEMFSDHTLHLSKHGSRHAAAQLALTLRDAGYL